MPTPFPFEVVILKERDYRPLYEESFKRPEYTDAFTEPMHRAEFGQFDRGLRKALTARWEEDYCGHKDFAMMDEGEAFGGWHHCGGIYSTRICCAEYVQTIIAVLAQLPHAALWRYHTACETRHDDTPLPVPGEFFVHGGNVFAPKDENDYASVFAGKRKWWRF